VLEPTPCGATFGSFTWHVDRHAVTLVRGRRVAIVGAGSWIGIALARLVARGHARHLLLLDGARQPLRRMMRELRDRRNFADVDARILDYTDRAEVEEAFADYPPEIVFQFGCSRRSDPKSNG
jgi:FlaA1/EpsC-like NDP-sugar epimerase